CRLFSEWLSPARMWSTSVATSVHRSPVSTLIHSHRYPARSRTIARMRRQFRGSRSPRLLVLHIHPSTRMEGWGILYGGSLSYAGLPIWGMAFPYAALPRRLPQNAECSSRSAPGHYTPLPHNITCPGARSPRVGGHFSVPFVGKRACRLRGSWGRALAGPVRGDAATVAAVLAVTTSSRVLGLSSAVCADGEVTRVDLRTLPRGFFVLQIPTRIAGTGISVGTGP